MKSETKREYHDNGQLSYIETVVTLTPNEYNPLIHKCARMSESGEIWIRTGLQAKYFSNGVTAWELHYTDTGDIDESRKFISRREDGSIIQM